jgi:hypothetical protein
MTLKCRPTALTILIGLAGCNTPDQRLAEFAEQASDQQARQNEAIARQSEQVARQSAELAAAAHDLVEQDAAARRDLLEAQGVNQQQFREQEAALDQQRQLLHAERREAAEAAVREPLIAQAVVVAALILATLLPLLVTAYALRRLPDVGAGERLLTDALVEDLTALPGVSPPVPPPEARLAQNDRPGIPPNDI